MALSAVDVVYRWHGNVYPPSGMRISQVYGYCFDPEGRVVLLRDGPDWNLPGGTPELFDEGHVATLAREVREEVQVEITMPVYLGYQEVCRNGEKPYAQLRMAARVTKLSPRAPDPDKGRTHLRRLCPLNEAMVLLGWGTAAEPQAKAAANVAEALWRLPVWESAAAYTD